ncbi:hypothetical protein CALCODRAFT_465471 [Calocera cornea HHB12733]|uniref:Uncharacterized protein n=1 Tax=Calocera cornea HHB12733 TaxID=1353952 RepID=A0A165IC27_9BASI|nr:hypothetical protein CALCODRAFT_465471 [Calocera cornea HHB12733]
MLLSRTPTRRTCSRAIALQSGRPALVRRTIFGWLRGKIKLEPAKPKPILEQDDLFHVFSTSPIPAMRERAQVIKSMASCPVCLDVHGENKSVQYDCPDCGWPTHCSKEHHDQDTEHMKYCGRLREVNEDEHDLRSGREMWEFNMPGEQGYEETISFANWDLLWYTRGFPSIDADRPRRHLSKVLTYPMTIAGILHQYSGFTTRNQRITPEGARSLAALRSVFFSDAAISSRENALALQDTIRIFIIGARAESSLPPEVWEQLNFCFPNVNMHLHFAGKRSRSELQKYGVPAYTDPRNRMLTLTSIQARYEHLHEQFGPFDPYTDVFFFFCPGFGFPSPTNPDLLQIQSPDDWAGILQQLLPTKCAIFVTGFSPTDVERDVKSLDGVPGVEGEFDWILTPGNNPFGSEKWDVADFDPRVMIRINWGVWGIRGKQREILARHVEKFAESEIS